jgi:epoxyqueuosine reductase QueG
MEPMGNFQAALVQAIQEYVHTSKLNRLRNIDQSPIWEEPLVGFADGDDALFDRYKVVVGETHLTPREALNAARRDENRAELLGSEAVSVVSWILPAARQTRLDNRAMTAGPSLRWNHSRFQGEELNDSLRRYVVAWLKQKHIEAAAPVLTGQFETLRSSKGWGSTWSERHAAYAAGLGTFSLSDGLITARGVAHRCGSVVAGVHWTPSPRRYTHHLENCTYYRDGSCKACMARCPAGAIGPEGHDKDKCREFLFVTLAEWVKKPRYIDSYGACGLCQTKVPCEHQIPDGRETEAQSLEP